MITETQKEEPPGVADNRLKIVELILLAPESRLQMIRDLYPEYFSIKAEVGSLEYISDLNSSYLKWKEDYGITKEWITEFPTIDVYNNYRRYCVENRFDAMDKKLFYRTLEVDFNFIQNQYIDESDFFISA